MELALQHGANHNFYTLSFILAKQVLLTCFENFQAVLPDF
ncbi:hypothetical protein [Citrobacter pasteurii]|nr:hypothetical protein SF123566_0274 [Shigella flexneri 1235-66]CEJ63150.1 hypothetical protein [Citrobacter pasteurii]